MERLDNNIRTVEAICFEKFEMRLRISYFSGLQEVAILGCYTNGDESVSMNTHI